MRLPTTTMYAVILGLVLSGSAAASRSDYDNRDTVLRLLQSGKTKKAADIAEQISYPRILACMRVDNRFIPVVQALPSHFDIDRAAEAFVAEARKESESKPQSLEAIVDYTQRLMDVLRYQDSLEVTLSAMNKISSAPKPRAVYRDLNFNLNWLLNQHASSLMGLKRWNEAADSLAAAAKMREMGVHNVSQAINLALMSAKMGRIKDAEQALESVGNRQSDYAQTQVQLARLIIAEQTNNRESSDHALDYLRRYQSVSVNTFQLALLEANRLDEAAGYLIERLRDPARRFDALCEVQDYNEYYAASARSPERVRLRIERWITVIQRKDVREEITKVGKIERFKLPSPM